VAKFQKGHEKVGGRKAGTPNKANEAARLAIAKFVNDNVEKLQSWLDKIAEKDPKQAYDCFMAIVEYHVPKLARTELAGDEDNPIKAVTDININLISKRAD